MRIYAWASHCSSMPSWYFLFSLTEHGLIILNVFSWIDSDMYCTYLIIFLFLHIMCIYIYVYMYINTYIYTDSSFFSSVGLQRQGRPHLEEKSRLWDTDWCSIPNNRRGNMNSWSSSNKNGIHWLI